MELIFKVGLETFGMPRWQDKHLNSEVEISICLFFYRNDLFKIRDDGI